MDSCGPLVRVVNINYGITGLGFAVSYRFILTSTSATLEETGRFFFGGVREDQTPRNISLVGVGPVIGSSLSYETALVTFTVTSTLQSEGSNKGAGTTSIEVWTSETGELGSATSKGRLRVSWNDFDLRDDDTGEIYNMAIWSANVETTLGFGDQLVITWAFYLPGQDPFPDLP